MTVEGGRIYGGGISIKPSTTILAPLKVPSKNITLVGDSRDLNVAVHGLRGVAAMMVLCAHVLGGTAEHIYDYNDAYVNWAQPYWNIGVFGVMLFFVISGFVILPSVLKYSSLDFAIRRFMRIYPLFFVATVTFATLNLLTNTYPDKNNLQSVVFSLFFLDLFTSTEQIAPNAWSLSYEVLFYFVATAAKSLYEVKTISTKIACIILPAAMVIVFPISIFFCVGAAIFYLDRHGLLQKVKFSYFFEITALIICVVSASRGHFTYHIDEFRNPWVWAVIGSLGTYFAFAIRASSITSKILGNSLALYLGTISYSLYLIHPYTYLICRHIFVRLGLFTPSILPSLVLFYAAVIPTSLLAAHVVHVSLERWPYQWFFKQGIYHGKIGRKARDAGEG